MSLLIFIVFWGSCIKICKCEVVINAIALDDILSEDYMPATLLMLENPNGISKYINNTVNTDVNLKTHRLDGTLGRAMETMDFHRSMMNQYLCRSFLADQIVSNMSTSRVKRRMGHVTPGIGEPTKSQFDIKKNLIYDEGSSGYKDWLSKSATLEDIYRHYDQPQNRVDVNEEIDEDHNEDFEEGYNVEDGNNKQETKSSLNHRHEETYYSGGGYPAPSYSNYGPPSYSQQSYGPPEYHHSDGGGGGGGYPQAQPESHVSYEPQYHEPEYHSPPPKYHVYNYYTKDKDLADLFEIALTALAFLAFKMFIVHVIMCITSVTTNSTTTTMSMAMSMSPTATGTGTGTGTGMTDMPSTGGDMPGTGGGNTDTGGGMTSTGGGMTDTGGGMMDPGGMTSTGGGTTSTGGGDTGGMPSTGEGTTDSTTGDGTPNTGGMTGTGGGTTGDGTTSTGDSGDGDTSTDMGGSTSTGDGNTGMGGGMDGDGDTDMGGGTTSTGSGTTGTDNNGMPSDGTGTGNTVGTSPGTGADGGTGMAETAAANTATGDGDSDTLQFRFKRSGKPIYPNPNNELMNELARKILVTIESALVAHKDDGVCLKKTLCENNRWSRMLEGRHKIFIPLWSLGMSWLSGRIVKNVAASTSMLDTLKASILGLGKANCEIIYQKCDLRGQVMERKRRKRRKRESF